MKPIGNRFNRLNLGWYLVRSLIIIGSVSFGGYMSLIAMVRQKLVLQDKVIEEERITEGIALGSLLPGPLAVNVVAYLGYGIGGVPGAILSTVAILLPSFVLTLALSVVYFGYDSVLNLEFILLGIIPVVIAIIFSMSFDMWRKNCTGLLEKVIAILSLAVLLLFPGYFTIVIIIIASAIGGIFLFKSEDKTQSHPGFRSYLMPSVMLLVIIAIYLLARHILALNSDFLLFDTFASASITMFGGGYVMIPVLKALLVDQLGWISSNEFFLGISLGQITPGPILISSVFFGYKVGGLMGSTLAVVGMFLPSSVLMVIASNYYTAVRNSSKVISALVGVRSAIVGLIIYSGFSLALSTKLFVRVEYFVLLIVVCSALLIKFKISPLKAVIAGGIIGFLTHLVMS